MTDTDLDDMIYRIIALDTVLPQCINHYRHTLICFNLTSPVVDFSGDSLTLSLAVKALSSLSSQ